MQGINQYVELSMAAIMLIALLGILIRITILKKGVGARVIQFTCVSFVLPAIVILAFEKILSGETVATLLGGLIGYVLSGISNFDKTDNNSSST